MRYPKRCLLYPDKFDNKRLICCSLAIKGTHFVEFETYLSNSHYATRKLTWICFQPSRTAFTYAKWPSTLILNKFNGDIVFYSYDVLHP